MSTIVTISSGDRAESASPAQTPVALGCCSGGTVGQIYAFDPGDDVAGSLGGGPLVDALYYLLAYSGGRVLASPCTPTWTGAPSVTKTGSGPAVALALADGASGCFDDHRLLITVKSGGAGGVAQADIAYDGTTVAESIVIPAPTPATLRGKVNIRYGLDLNGLTMVFTSPTAKTLTFPTSTVFPASSATALLGATATVAAPVTKVTADLTAAAVALLDGANGAQLVFTSGGTTPANVPATVTIAGILPDGTAGGEVLNLLQSAGTATSVNRYKGTDLSLLFSAADDVDATISIGYADVYPTPASIVDKLNALAAAAPYAATFSAAEDGTGAVYLEMASTALGAAVTITIDAGTSTGDGTLGFTAESPSNLTATGASASLVLPYTGIEAFFDATEVYVSGTTYAATCVGPKASIAALAAGYTAARDDYDTNPFGFAVVCQPASTPGNCVTLEATLSALELAWRADPSAAIFVSHVIGSPFHTASATLATNDANIGTADAALLAAFASAGACLDSVAHEDGYVASAAPLPAGSLRRSSALAWAVKRATVAKLAADVGDGLVPGFTLRGPDGLTRARDESRATTKLGGGAGPGFSCLGSAGKLSNVLFAPGATRAGSSSRLRYSGPVFVANEMARQLYGETQGWNAQTIPTDPETGQLEEGARKSREGQLEELLRPTLRPDTAGAEPNVSSFRVTIPDPPSGRFIDNGRLPIKARFIPLGEVEAVTIDITAVGTVIA